MLAVACGCRHRRSFASFPAAHLLLCRLIPNRPLISMAQELGTPDMTHEFILAF